MSTGMLAGVCLVKSGLVKSGPVAYATSDDDGRSYAVLGKHGALMGSVVHVRRGEWARLGWVGGWASHGCPAKYERLATHAQLIDAVRACLPGFIGQVHYFVTDTCELESWEYEPDEDQLPGRCDR